MKTLYSFFIRCLQYACVVLFTGLVSVVVLQVITRQIFNAPLTWTTPTAQYLFVWLALAGTALLFGLKEHVAVDVFMRLVRLEKSRALEIGIQSLSFLFSAAVLVYGGMRGVLLTWSQAIPGFPLTFGMVFLMLPVAGIIACFFCFHHILEAARGRGLPDEDSDDFTEVV